MHSTALFKVHQELTAMPNAGRAKVSLLLDTDENHWDTLIADGSRHLSSRIYNEREYWADWAVHWNTPVTSLVQAHGLCIFSINSWVCIAALDYFLHSGGTILEAPACPSHDPSPKRQPQAGHHICPFAYLWQRSPMLGNLSGHVYSSWIWK